MSLGTPLVLAGATMLALGAAACSLDFDRYVAATDATSGYRDVGADTPGAGGEDSAPDVGPGEDAGPSGDAAGDGSPGPDGNVVDCGAVAPGCESEAGACGSACGATSQQCQSQCNSNPCRKHCQQVEQTCRQGCENACTSCIGNAGCSAGCADAAFAD